MTEHAEFRLGNDEEAWHLPPIATHPLAIGVGNSPVVRRAPNGIPGFLSYKDTAQGRAHAGRMLARVRAVLPDARLVDRRGEA